MPYFRELQDGKKVLVSTMKMLTRADGEWLADKLNSEDPNHFYEARPSFMGYEGYDCGVSKYECETWCGAKYKRKFIKSFLHSELIEMCAERPMVHQSVSHLSLEQEANLAR